MTLSEEKFAMAIRVELGTDLSDTITAQPGENLIAFGGDGDDSLTGAELADFLSGEDGDDNLVGNEGDDILDGGNGADTFNTGAGNDLILAGPGDDTVGGMAGSDVVFGGDGNDLVAWNDPIGDRVFGDDGNDVLRGGDIAADTISGGAGDDLIRAVANQQLETHAPDILFGNEGNDSILGGNAADTIDGGEGDDILAGFGGADRFIFRADQPGNDTINDFDTTQDVAVLLGFGTNFDPLANLSQEASGTVLDLGDAGEVVFFGHLVNEFGAEDFFVA
jgi:serralysin